MSSRTQEVQKARQIAGNNSLHGQPVGAHKSIRLVSCVEYEFVPVGSALPTFTTEPDPQHPGDVIVTMTPDIGIMLCRFTVPGPVVAGNATSSNDVYLMFLGLRSIGEETLKETESFLAKQREIMAVMRKCGLPHSKVGIVHRTVGHQIRPEDTIDLEDLTMRAITFAGIMSTQGDKVKTLRQQHQRSKKRANARPVNLSGYGLGDIPQHLVGSVIGAAYQLLFPPAS